MDLSGDEGGGIRKQESGELRDMIRVSDGLQGVTFFSGFFFRFIPEELISEWRIGEGGGDGVDANFRSELGGEGFI